MSAGSQRQTRDNKEQIKQNFKAQRQTQSRLTASHQPASRFIAHVGESFHNAVSTVAHICIVRRCIAVCVWDLFSVFACLIFDRRKPVKFILHDPKLRRSNPDLKDL